MAGEASRSWIQAWECTLTGPVSFYRAHAPEEHFTTTVLRHDGIARLIVTHVIELLSAPSPGPSASGVVVTDLGSGHGVLLRDIDALLRGEGARSWVRLVGVDLRGRPIGLGHDIEWVTADARSYLSSVEAHRGVMVAHELLDDIPLTIVEYDEHGVLRRIDADARNLSPILGDPHRDEHDERWLERWWPGERPLSRAEIGLPRDALWAQMLEAISDGVCLAVDYGHVLAERTAGTWDGGTCVGYRKGHVVTPVADGSCNITAHVSFDSLTSVGQRLPAPVVSIEQPLPGAFGAPVDMRMLQSWCGPSATRARCAL